MNAYPLPRPTAELIRLAMVDHDLNAETVARMVRVSPHTVRAWLKPSTSKSHNRAPETAAVLLYLLLGEPLPRELDPQAEL